MRNYFNEKEDGRQKMPMVKFDKKAILGVVFAAIAVLFLFMMPKIGEDVPNERIVVNQAPFTGRMSYWTTPGFKWQWFGTTTEYYKTQQLWFGSDADGQQQGEPIPVIFNDASNGEIYGSLRIKLPTDSEHLARIQTDYNGMERLMNDLVRPTVVKVVYASGPLMSAFESYAEKKNDLIEYITDQLVNGVYKTRVITTETQDALTGEVKQTKQASLVPDDNAPGGYARSEVSPFSHYGLEVGQVAVSKISYSERVTAQIEQQQQANMSVQTARAQALQAQQDAITVEEKGKAAAAQAKWEQEKIKAVAVTQAEQEREVSRLAAEKAEFDKKKIIAEGEAEAAANRAKVAAGLTPQERAEWDYKTKVGVANALKDIQLPRIVMAGGTASSGSTAMDAMGLKMITDLVDKMSKE